MVEYLGNGLVELDGGFEVIYKPNEAPLLAINKTTLRDVLNTVFKLESRFNLRDEFGKYVNSLFKDFFIYDDESYAAPIGKHDINLILRDWEDFMKSTKLRYSLIPEIDCDDYARLFQEFLAFKYRWNLCGRAWGLLGIQGKEGSVEYYGHAFNWVGVPLLYKEWEGVAYVWFLIVEPQISTFTVPRYNGEGIIRLSNSFLLYKPYVCMG